MEKEHLLYDENSESGCFDRHRRFFFASATVVFLLGITTIAALSYTTLTLAHENENLKHEKVCGTPYTHNYANPNIADTALQPKGSLLVKNCHLWTGEPLAAESPVPGLTDVLIQNGTITSIGVGLTAPEGTTVLDAAGHHCTPGIIDMHSHLGVYSLPEDGVGNADGNDDTGVLSPFLRARDAIDPHDPAIDLIRGGGITSSVVLPGSANVMGGEGVMVKLRPSTAPNGQRRVSALQIPDSPRVLKFACGENPKNNYGRLNPPQLPASRMGINYLLRKAFDKASRDAAALANQNCSSAPSPDILNSEPLIALLEGKALAFVHCYKTTDMLAVIEVAKDYNWSIAAFHHSIEAWKIADTLAKEKIITATFAQHGLFKMEGYRMNPTAASVLVEAGAKVAFKSDHPVLFGRDLVRQAGIALHHGLKIEYALPSVTSVPAEAMGLHHKIGRLVVGLDGDLVIWNTNPLSSRVRAKTVVIDGIITNNNPEMNSFPDYGPATGACESCNTCSQATSFALHGISEVITLTGAPLTNGTIIIEDGIVTCVGTKAECPSPQGASIHTFSGNSVAIPGLIAAGVHIGNKEVHQERDSWDGVAPDVGKNDEFVAADGAAPHLYGGKHTSLAMGAGVTTTILNAQSSGVIQGISSCLQNIGDLLPGDALIGERVGLSITIGNSAKSSGQSLSISGQIAMLREKLSSPSGIWNSIVNGTFPLVISVQQRDTIAALLRLHSSVCPEANFILNGASEAHHLADQIAKKSPKVSVMLAPWRPFSFDTWHGNEEAYRILHSAGVKVGLAPPGQADPDQVAWYIYNAAQLTTQNGISREDALRAVTKNVADIYNLSRFQLSGTIQVGTRANVVVWSGDPLEYQAQILYSVTGHTATCNPKYI